jgi:hypothetical protein
MSFRTGRDHVVPCRFAPDATDRMQLHLVHLLPTSGLPLIDVAFTSLMKLPFGQSQHPRGFICRLFLRACTALDIVNSTFHFPRSLFRHLLLTELPTVTTLRIPTPPQAFHFFFTFYPT